MRCKHVRISVFAITRIFDRRHSHNQELGSFTIIADTMKFSMLAIVAAAMSASVHGFAGTPLRTNFAVRSVS
jgi:hypothetical protein